DNQLYHQRVIYRLMTYRSNNKVDDKLRNPEQRQRQKSGDQAQTEAGQTKGWARLPDEFKQGRDVFQGNDSLSPGLRRLVIFGRRRPHALGFIGWNGVLGRLPWKKKMLILANEHPLSCFQVSCASRITFDGRIRSDGIATAKTCL